MKKLLRLYKEKPKYHPDSGVVYPDDEPLKEAARRYGMPLELLRLAPIYQNLTALKDQDQLEGYARREENRQRRPQREVQVEPSALEFSPDEM